MLTIVEPSPKRPRTQILNAYEIFLLEKRGESLPRDPELLPVSTLAILDLAGRPGVENFIDLTPNLLRAYRAQLAEAPTKRGTPRAGESLLSAHRAVKSFLRWAAEEEHSIDPRLLTLKRPRVEMKEMPILHVDQIRGILQACSTPQQNLMVRTLIGSGIRASELCGLGMTGTDGLPDVITETVDPGRAELRIRWDGGAKGQKARRIPIGAKLAVNLRKYALRGRPDVPFRNLLISHFGRPYTRAGITQAMQRIETKVGFKVHPHLFRHTWATVCVQVGWNLELIRAAAGHSHYSSLMRYVRLSSERSLGAARDWIEFIPGPFESPSNRY